MYKQAISPHATLRLNMKPFGVSVSIIEPGFFKTNITRLDLIEADLERLWSRLPQEVKDSYGPAYLDECEWSVARRSSNLDDKVRILRCFVLPSRPEGSSVLHGRPVQFGHLQGDPVHGARTHGSLPPHALLCWLGRQAALDPSDLPALVRGRLRHQGAFTFTQGANKPKLLIATYLYVSDLFLME